VGLLPGIRIAEGTEHGRDPVTAGGALRTHDGLCPLITHPCRGNRAAGAHALDADTGEYCVLDGCDDRCQCILIEGVRRQGREREVLCKACGLLWCGCAEIDDAYARGLRDAAGASGSYLDGRRDAAAAIEAFLHCDPCDCVHCSLLTVVSNAALGTAIDPGAGR
jgi:hypothetical protein